MKLINKTTRKPVAHHLVIASGIKEKTLGLLDNQVDNLFMTTRFGIHTFGMKQDIKVVILNKDMKIVAIRTVQPNRFFAWNPLYKNVLELTKELSGSSLKKGDVLQIKE